VNDSCKFSLKNTCALTLSFSLTLFKCLDLSREYISKPKNTGSTCNSLFTYPLNTSLWRSVLESTLLTEPYFSRTYLNGQIPKFSMKFNSSEVFSSDSNPHNARKRMKLRPTGHFPLSLKYCIICCTIIFLGKYMVTCRKKQCGFSFHKPCMIDWLVKRNNYCPLCSALIIVNSKT